MPFIESGRLGAEVSLDYEIHKNFYPVIEAGWQKTDTHSEEFNYRSDGSYGRIGLDYNIFKRNPKQKYDMVFPGLRFGYSKSTQGGDGVIVNYWGNYKYNLPEFDVTAYWLEFAGGMKVEIIKNIFIGWSGRARFMLNHTDTDIMDSYLIPGFGDSEKKVNLGINYSIFYRFPIVNE